MCPYVLEPENDQLTICVADVQTLLKPRTFIGKGCERR